MEMGFYYTDKHVSEKNKRFMASLVMTSLLLSQGVAYTNYNAQKELERKITEQYNGNVGSAGRQSMENLENALQKNKTIGQKLINPIELNETELIDIKDALDREYEKGKRDGYNEGYKEGYKNGLKDKKRR